MKTTKRITVLLAEDHVVVRESIRQSLELKPDIEVIGEAGNGEETVRMARELMPDVILMDISMPGLNGIEATKQIKAFQPSAVILVLTAYDYEQYVFPILEAGAAGYLLKDISSNELISAIHNVHKGEAVLHPTVARKLLEKFRHNPIYGNQEETKDLLTEREITVLKLAARGKSNVEIAQELFLSVRTVESRFGSIFNKIGVASRTEAVIEALKRGSLTLEELR